MFCFIFFFSHDGAAIIAIIAAKLRTIQSFNSVSFFFLHPCSRRSSKTMDTRDVVYFEDVPNSGIRRTYSEQVTVSGIARYVIITSIRDPFRARTRTVLVQSISMSPDDHRRLVLLLPEVFARFANQTFGDFRSWSESITDTVAEIIEELRGLNRPQRMPVVRRLWPRNFTFSFLQGLNQRSTMRLDFC